MNRNRRRGLSLISLLATIVMLVILMTIVATTMWPRGGAGGEEGTPGPSLAQQKAHRSACLSNLRSIHIALKMYETSENRLPMVRYQPSSDAGVNAAPTAANATNSRYGESSWDELGDQAMQTMWLLIQNSNIGLESFRCPGDAGYQERNASQRYGWTSSNQYSYAIQWPYRTSAADDRNPAQFRSNMPEYLVIMADRNPGGPVGEDRPPSNHPLVGTSTVVWSGTIEGYGPANSRAGIDNDDIYTNANGEAGGMPISDEDTSLTLSPR
jgi:hypothetical protein